MTAPIPRKYCQDCRFFVAAKTGKEYGACHCRQAAPSGMERFVAPRIRTPALCQRHAFLRRMRRRRQLVRAAQRTGGGVTSPYIQAAAASLRTEHQVRELRQVRALSPPPDLPCPWCGTGPGHATLRAGRYLVGCESEECPANPQVGGATVLEAWSAWNQRAA